jgi:transposase InsO family protein
VPETDETLVLTTVIDATFLDCPWYGSRQMARHLRRRLTNAWHRSKSSVLRRPVESAQFTSQAFTAVLREAEVRISMDGRGRWMDNVFIERLWRSLK